MKRIMLGLFLVVCLLMSGQAVSLAGETVTVVSPDDPGFYGGTVTVPITDTWATNPSFMTGVGWQPVALSAEEAAAVAAKEQSVDESITADQADNPQFFDAAIDPSDPAAITNGFTPMITRVYANTYFKIPNYNQGNTPYCGPFSALQILRYKRYNEYGLIGNLIREMYISGCGSSIYKLCGSLNRRLNYIYIVSTVTNIANYVYKHFLTVGRDRMPIDNLVRIYPLKLGKYRAYHAGHFIDSSGYSINNWKNMLYITDTYQEYFKGTASGTLGPQWVSMIQMYQAVRAHPLQKVVY